jgi:D-psicose/D-tagatose/L-ribulose 3-epimerase
VKLSVCNIAWDLTEQDSVLALLERRKVRGIEVAPTKLWPEWSGAEPQSATDWRRGFASRDFEVPALQAILFGKPELKLFATDSVREATLDHLGRVASLARALGARVLVFGSPRNRDRGDLSHDQAFAVAVDFFREAGRLCARHDVWLCIEPNPEAYASNFVTRWREALDLVLAVDEPGFGLHLDSGCIHLAGDDPAEAVLACAGLIRHFHVSEPHLAALSAPVVDHRRAGEALHKAGYEGWISIEMRRADQPLDRIDEAVERVSTLYGTD